MSKKNYNNLYNQLALPFLAIKKVYIKEIFETLELRHGLEKQSKQQFIDLGSGDGRVVIYAALNHGIRSIGVEINDNLVKEAKENLKLAKVETKGAKSNLRKAKIIQGDLFQLNLEGYNYVYIFSLPTIHEYLKHVFLTTRRGTIIIAHKYPLIQEIFNSFLKLEYELKHEPEISTYFYSKF